MIKEMFKKKDSTEENNPKETIKETVESSEFSDNSPNPGNPENSDSCTLPGSSEALEKAYCLGAGIDEETLKKAKEILSEINASVTTGSFSPTALQFAIRLLNYDSDIEEARKRGMEIGRAEQIAEAFHNKRSKAEEAAGIPHLGGTAGIGAAKENTIFDLARQSR